MKNIAYKSKKVTINLLLFIIPALIMILIYSFNPFNVITKSYVTRNNWTTILTNNKWISSKLYIKNYTINYQDIYIRCLDNHGKIIVEPKLISCGKTEIIYDSLRLFQGNYIIQAKAKNIDKYYKIELKDQILKN